MQNKDKTIVFSSKRVRKHLTLVNQISEIYLLETKMLKGHNF